MPHGGPDWSTGGQISTVHTIEDLGELAARLGSIVTFDRRGNVIAYDDFESGLSKWYRWGDTGYEITWNSEFARSGGFCCKVQTGAVTNYTAGLTRAMGYPALSPIGIEFSFARHQNLKYIELIVRVRSLDKMVAWSLRYDHANSKFQYLFGGRYNDVPDLVFAAIPKFYGSVCFHTVKLVIDPVNQKYKRLIIDNQMADLSNYSIDLGAGGTPYLETQICMITSADEAGIIYFDNVIWTQNEP